MISSVRFQNFRVLRDTTLPLSRVTLVVGPNGSGKSTAVEALDLLKDAAQVPYSRVASVGIRTAKKPVTIEVTWDVPSGATTLIQWGPGGAQRPKHSGSNGKVERFDELMRSVRVFELDAKEIAATTALEPTAEMARSGRGLAVVLDRLRDQAPERFEELNREVPEWLPEYDRILFDTPAQGKRSLQLRTRAGAHRISAGELSEGSLLALAILTLAYLPDPPALVCLEEPDRAVHPRLLRNLQDALYRLAYPGAADERREPVQVVATTHNPYFLNLFRDHPDEVVIANKHGLEATFQRVSELPHILEILEDAPLGDVWYTGVLGGVPVAA